VIYKPFIGAAKRLWRIRIPLQIPCLYADLELPFFVSEKRPAMQLKLTAHKLNDGIVVVDCAGRIVFGEETSELREQVKALISDGGRVVLNLGEVNYIDSGGLGTLVALYTSARSAGGAIKLARLTRRVGDLLQVTKLLTVFEVYETEEEAVESFRKSAAA
jgi:anti-sigma B factor antagonist